MCFGGFWLVVVVLIMAFLVLPVLAQVQPEEEAKSEPILRIVVTDLKVQGEQSPEAVREALNGILPQLIDCIQAEYGRAGKVPHRYMIRFNLGGNGKVVWSKVIDPPLKSLDACISKVLPKIQLPSAGTGLSRVTIMLETKMDHLLAP
jgi:hypothetical protein